MGKRVAEMASERGHEIVARLGSNQDLWGQLSLADICVEFTRPESAVENIKRCAALKKNVVVGTTGWYDHIEEISPLAEEIGILYAPNFSLGVFLWLKMVSYSAALMNAFDDYEVGALEFHHKQKLDAPSGTAQWMANRVEEKIDRVKKLDVTSIRMGSLPGTHTLIYDSPVDTITIQHEARNPKGFAKGALIAAEWLQGKKGLYTLEDLWKDV